MLRFLICTSLIIACSGVLSAEPQLTALRGAVADPAGLPVEKASVNAKLATQDVGQTVRTDSNGTFSLPLTFGRYRIRVEADGFRTDSRIVDFTRGGEEIAITCNYRNNVRR